MYTFITTHEHPALSQLSTAYDRLSGAIRNAVEATIAARRADDALHGARGMKNKIPSLIAERENYCYVCSVREQAAKQPLIDAITEMLRVLEILDGVPTHAWPHWQTETRKINVVCAVDLLKQAIAAYDRISPYRFNSTASQDLGNNYSEALRWYMCTPSELPASIAEMDFLMRCMNAVERSSTGACCVAVDEVDPLVVQRIGSLLRQAGWHAEMQEDMGPDIAPGFQLRHPAAACKCRSRRRR